MKRLARHILLAAAALLAVACTDDPAENPAGKGGAATFAIAAPQSRAEGPEEEAYPWNRCTIRIYKKTEEGRELIRRYDKRSELPESLWLLAGDYTIAVEAGSRAEATFTEPTYAGETDFAIADGRTTMVEVECRIVNTMVKVAYDATVAATFKESYSTEVVFGDPANTRAPRLTYDGNATGYFMLPAEPTTLNWIFRGKGEKNGQPLELEKTGAKELTPEPGVRYELKLKYSADLGGALDFVLTLDENPDEVDDPIVFVPVPQIAGDGFDLTETQEYLTGTRSYRITSIADMATIAVGAAGEVFTIPATGNYAADANGIALEYANPTEMRLTLGEAFFALLPAGEHTVTLTATDADDGESTKETKVRMLQGAYALTSTDGWNARGRLEALVHDAASAHDVKIRYRRVGTTEWTVAEAASADGGKYAADVADIHANTAYEYQLLFGEEPVNGIARTTMGDGMQIPNSDFEQWSIGLENALIPSASTIDQWWDTGNRGSQKMNKNVTTNVDDPRPGSAGRTAAKLQSQFVGLGSIGKFAAGNLFVGEYLTTNGTNGVIGFSKAFDFTYRPKKLRFWYKGNTGTIDNADSASGKNKGDSDISTVYLCLCATTGPHVTNTADSGTFFASTDRTIQYCSDYVAGSGSNTNNAEGHVIGAAVWEKDNSYQQTEWKQIEVDVEYYPEYEGEKPAYLLLIASASKYGDYFTGSTASVMYLDDLEIVY